MATNQNNRLAEMMAYVDTIVDQAINPFVAHTDEWNRFEDYVENIVATAMEFSRGDTDLDPREAWETAEEIIAAATDF